MGPLSGDVHDNGNIDADDGCSETCALDRRVFVSSVLYPGGKLGGVHTADRKSVV